MAVARGLEELIVGHDGNNGEQEQCCLPAFRLVRGGLAIDEFHAHGRAYEDEVHKRVDAALSLSREDDLCE